MIGWIIQVTIVSIILILLIHHLINYFKATFTVPKVKDLVNSPIQEYQKMYDVIQKGQNNSLERSLPNSESFDHLNNNNVPNDFNNNIDVNDCTLIDSLPTMEMVEHENVVITKENESINMKNELKNFLKGQL